MSANDCDVAVIGAGPYGLATAAHLTAAKVTTRVFGEPMSFWQRHMPEGMRLRSPWVASHIAHPNGDWSLDAYAATHGLAPQEQLPIRDFIDYGHWFQKRTLPGLDTRTVTRVERTGNGFSLRLKDGEETKARRVVIAMGLAHQEFTPAPFDGLPRALISHTCDHVSFDALRGKRVAVIGRGQSACETAALLSEAGSEVELISRGDVLWLASEEQEEAGEFARQLRRLTTTRGAIGPFPLNWLAEAPVLVHRLPPALRARFSTRCLRAKASGWLRPRFGAVEINANRTVRSARSRGGQVALELDNGTRTFDHVVLGTGYKIDIAKLGILAPQLLAGIATDGGSPRLGWGMESSVAGLHFVGATAVQSFGPLMRFVWGAGFAADSVTRAALGTRLVESQQAVMPRPGVGVFSPREPLPRV